MPQILEHAITVLVLKNIPEAEERQRTFVLDTAQNHGIKCVSHLIFISATSPILLSVFNFVFKCF